MRILGKDDNASEKLTVLLDCFQRMQSMAVSGFKAGLERVCGVAEVNWGGRDPQGLQIDQVTCESLLKIAFRSWRHTHRCVTV
jgi:hypothetical protein